ncbi:MAG: Spy/CpxP family protein refolding chaperone [Betaproteobacteria bacterium]|nr:Spy/CpxP family protein refolding chaperone [Betaproteobacteria bacterium]
MDQQPQTPLRRRFFRFAAAGAALAGLSGLAWKAAAHGGRSGGPIDPARLDEHLERMLKHLYVEIDATAAQQQKLEPIIKQAAKELMPLREKVREARRQGMELLSAPSIDRAAIERLRVEQISSADQASKRFVRALADVAEVLTPEQRKIVAERMQRRRHGHRWG